MLYKSTLTYLLKIYKKIDLDTDLDIGNDVSNIENAWQSELGLPKPIETLWTVFDIYKHFYKDDFVKSTNSHSDVILALCAIHPKIIKEL